MRSFLFLMIAFSSCAEKQNDQSDFNLIIEVANSYKYDFTKEIYTIFYTNKVPEEIKFKLTEAEKKSIRTKYYDLNLDKLPQKLYIDGTCNILPKTFTTINIMNEENALQTIKIETGCSYYNLFKYQRAKRINNFINFAYQIVRSKSEIKKSSKSNIKYM